MRTITFPDPRAPAPAEGDLPPEIEATFRVTRSGAATLGWLRDATGASVLTDPECLRTAADAILESRAFADAIAEGDYD